MFVPQLVFDPLAVPFGHLHGAQMVPRVLGWAAATFEVALQPLQDTAMNFPEGQAPQLPPQGVTEAEHKFAAIVVEGVPPVHVHAVHPPLIPLGPADGPVGKP